MIKYNMEWINQYSESVYGIQLFVSDCWTLNKGKKIIQVLNKNESRYIIITYYLSDFNESAIKNPYCFSCYSDIKSTELYETRIVDAYQQKTMIRENVIDRKRFNNKKLLILSKGWLMGKNRFRTGGRRG